MLGALWIGFIPYMQSDTEKQSSCPTWALNGSAFSEETTLFTSYLVDIVTAQDLCEL